MTATGSRLHHLSCRACCAEVEPDTLRGTCPTCGHTLLAEYGLDGLDGRRWWSEVRLRPPTLWKYRELLPIRDDRAVVTLGEAEGPVLRLEDGELASGLELWAKDDGGLPTGSFKARGMTVAVSRARELGARRLFAPSAGNAGIALAAYAARAGVPATVYLPEKVDPRAVESVSRFGAEVVRVGATIREAGEEARRREAGRGFDLSTLREPYRVEGKKTMALEIAERFGPDRMPDAIVYPTGGGTGLVGMHKGFGELRALGLLDREPRLIAVQAEGCAPVVRALQEGATKVRPWEEPVTVAPGLAVPAPFASERLLEAVRASGGTGVSVPDRAILAAQRTLAERHGLSVAVEAAAPWAALEALRRTGAVHDGERVLLYLTGRGP
jgi:threonine synthase